jgi:hypothetical protein
MRRKNEMRMWVLGGHRRDTMCSQKVPRMLALHCNSRTFGNAYLISFKASPLLARTHTHTHTLAPSIPSFLEAQVKGFFGIFWSLAVDFDFMPPHGCEMCPLFQRREQPKVTRSEIRRVRWLGDDTTSDVWLDAETTAPACHLQSRFLCKTSTVTLSRRYGLTVHQNRPCQTIPGTF